MSNICLTFCPDEGKCFPENVRHLLKILSTMKVFVILWLFNYLNSLPRIIPVGLGLGGYTRFVRNLLFSDGP